MADGFLALRPGGFERNASTPASLDVIKLMGEGGHSEGVTFSRDEVRAMTRLYGFNLTRERSEPVPAQTPPTDPGPSAGYFERHKYETALSTHERENSPEALRKRTAELHHFEMAGAWRNCARHVMHDGQRMVALIAKFCEPGSDPVRLLADLMQNAGYDLHTGWEGEDEEAGEDDLDPPAEG